MIIQNNQPNRDKCCFRNCSLNLSTRTGHDMIVFLKHRKNSYVALYEQNSICVSSRLSSDSIISIEFSPACAEKLEKGKKVRVEMLRNLRLRLGSDAEVFKLFSLLNVK